MHNPDARHRSRLENLVVGVARNALITGIRILIGARGIWVAGVPEMRQRIYFANHASHFDTLAVLASLPREVRAQVSPIAARDYWTRSKVHRFIAVDCLRSTLIDRTHSTDADPLEPVFATLAQGRSILIFPEGTRGDGSEIARFRGGLHRLAEALPNVELVPVHLDNLSRIMPKGSFLIVPITCNARYGEPMHLESGETRETFLDRARQAVAALARPMA